VYRRRSFIILKSLKREDFVATAINRGLKSDQTENSVDIYDMKDSKIAL